MSSGAIKELATSLKDMVAEVGEEAKGLRSHVEQTKAKAREKIGLVRQRIVEVDDAVAELDNFLIEAPGGNNPPQE